MSAEERLRELLDKYRRGSCSPEEERLLEQWLDELGRDAEAEPVFSPEEETGETGKAMWKEIQAGTTRTRSRPVWRRLAQAAILAGVVISGLWLYRTRDTLLRPFGPDTVLQWDTLTTRPGSLRKVILADGSEVVMNANSALRYTKGFGKKARQVELIYGEARFEVTRDAGRSFTVHSRGVDTRVLGTRFTVTAYRELEDVRVSVDRGRVEVKRDTALLGVLTAHQQISYHTITEKITATEGHTAVFDPENQRYLLRNCSFKELSVRLENAFGYRLVAGNEEAGRYTFTGDLNLREPLQVILRKFSAIHGGGFTIKEKEVLMY